QCFTLSVTATPHIVIYLLSLHDALPIYTDALDGIADGRLRAILAFTRKLIVKPVDGNQAEIAKLTTAGMASADIVTLGQLIGFRSEEHTSELQSRFDLVCRLLLENKKSQ